MSGTESIKAPAEAGSRRLVLLTVREKAACKVCGESILRVSSATEDTWIHTGRTRGQAYAHQARSSIGGSK